MFPIKICEIRTVFFTIVQKFARGEVNYHFFSGKKLLISFIKVFYHLTFKDQTDLK